MRTRRTYSLIVVISRAAAFFTATVNAGGAQSCKTVRLGFSRGITNLTWSYYLTIAHTWGTRLHSGQCGDSLRLSYF
jgi:hypothetical protein